MSLAAHAAEQSARQSYGRLVGRLAAGSDRASAEDALAEAFRAALAAWPERGVPDDPDAWLFTAARRRLVDAARRRRVRTDVARATQVSEAAPADPPLTDERLALLFACVHPAVPEDMRAPLMLQVVLGLDAARIGSCFLVAPATMGQRLVRAKAAIRDSGARFAWPEPDELPARARAVLEAIYAAYGSAWDHDGSDPRQRGLIEEALWLAHVAAALLPDDPEAAGLLALLLHCEARRPARADTKGNFVPLDEQDSALWLWSMIRAADAALTQAAAMRQPGRFQLEAAIQSAHVGRLAFGRPAWDEIALLYEGLRRIAPTIGARIGHAVAVARVLGPERGLALLDELDSPRIATHQPFWVARGHLLAEAGGPACAAAFERAIGLTENPALRDHLMRRRAACSTSATTGTT